MLPTYFMFDHNVTLHNACIIYNVQPHFGANALASKYVLKRHACYFKFSNRSFVGNRPTCQKVCLYGPVLDRVLAEVHTLQSTLKIKLEGDIHVLIIHKFHKISIHNFTVILIKTPT